ncbi:hypothetical protein BH10PSE12_BH10PSE12_11990 [soil metagenome]
MRMIGMTVLVAILGGCGDAKTSSNQSAPPGAAASNYTAQVIALPELQRNGVFFRAIRDAGLPCQSVKESEMIAAAGQTPTWRATCDGDVGHLIQVTRDGTVNIVSRPTP